MLTAAETEEIRTYHARRFKEERRRDAEDLAEYQRECAASWEGKETKCKVV